MLSASCSDMCCGQVLEECVIIGFATHIKCHLHVKNVAIYCLIQWEMNSKGVGVLLRRKPLSHGNRLHFV